MSDFVMLHGPAYSGKSTLARELALNYGYLLINFTDNLKVLASHALTAAGHSVTVEYMKAHKDTYRPFLQALNDAIGYNEDPAHITRACAHWEACGRPNAVFDNVRSEPQVRELTHMGFRLVEILLPLSMRKLRAEDNGHVYHVWNDTHPIEQPLSESIPRSQVLLGTFAPERLAYEVAHYAY